MMSFLTYLPKLITGFAESLEIWGVYESGLLETCTDLLLWQILEDFLVYLFQA